MKWLVWILLILNFTLLGFFIASSYFADPPPDPLAVAPYNGPIKILTPEELATMPKKTPEPAAPAPVVVSCYEWSGIPPGDASRVKLALKKLGLEATAKSQSQDGKTRYWVYLPAQKSMAQAEAKVAELQGMGISDSLIIQDPKWRYAISLGIFKDEALANAFLQKLKGLGVKNAAKIKRDHGNTQTNYSIRNVSPEDAEKLNALKPHFSGSELNAVDCQ
jgi:hypothetical protein